MKNLYLNFSIFFKKISILSLLIIALMGSVMAQDSTKVAKKSYFKGSISYLTNAVYGGRKDSLVNPYITPSIGYYNKSGFFVEGSLSYLAASGDSGIDLFALQTGYDFTFGDQLSGGIYGSKYFYATSSTAIRSESKGSVGGNLSYDPGFATFSGGLDLSFSKKADINVLGAISHPFYLGDTGNEWSITPTTSVNLGTQNYFEDYLVNRKNKVGKRMAGGNKSGKKGGSSSTTTITTTKTKSSSSFNLLDYELSVPITYDSKKWGVYFTPTYAIPENPISVPSSTGIGYETESLVNTFYSELGVYLKF
jgi:hypothetical protein